MDWPFLRNFGITLFALLNPLGMLPIFINYTARETRRVQQLVALFVSLTVLGLLLLFMLSGTALLAFFGVTLNSFRIAGGILLLGIGIGIVNGTAGGGAQALEAQQVGQTDLMLARSAYRQIVIPMAMPLLVGPGVIANVILYSSEAPDHGFHSRLALIGITIGVSLLVCVVLASGKSLQRLLGDIGLSITQRVMGLFVAAIGMQFMVNGVLDIFRTKIVPLLPH